VKTDGDTANAKQRWWWWFHYWFDAESKQKTL